MSKKISLRIPEELYERLSLEWQKFGYRSLNAFVVARLEKETVIEIEGGRELAKALFQMSGICHQNACGRRREKCPSLDLLMIRIERLIDCIKSSNM